MNISMQQRLAGICGGAALVIGTFFPAFVLLQIITLVPLLILLRKESKISTGAVVGLYMGLTYVIPQIIYFKMPPIVTVILLIYMTVLLVCLCSLTAILYKKPGIITCFAIGGLWYLIDFANYSLVPIWGVAQSFARPWSYYPILTGLISYTGISGVLFAIGSLQALSVEAYFQKGNRLFPILSIIALICVSMGLFASNSERQSGHLKIAAAGWVLDERDDSSNPNLDIGFEKLVRQPAKEAAAQGARVFTTGEMGFYFADHNRKLWMDRFAEIAAVNNMWMIVGYYDLTHERNMIFFMNPSGEVVETYNKTYLTPFEPGIAGNGSLKIVDIDGVKVGAMICHDDNYYDMTRYYGNLKADIVLCPTADWSTVKDVHLQAVRSRALECNYSIVRPAANGISAAISPYGEIIQIMDHYKEGPGVIVANVPVFKKVTFFSKYGYLPMILLSTAILLIRLVSKANTSLSEEITFETL